MPSSLPPTPLQVERTLQSVLHAAKYLINEDPVNFAVLCSTFLTVYTHPTFQLILGIPPPLPSNPPPPSKQLQDELLAIKSSVQALTKSVASLQPKAKEAKAPTAKTPSPAGNPSAQGKGPSFTLTPTYASKATSRSQPSLVLDIGATDPDNQLDPSLNDSLNGHMHKLGRDEIKFSAARYNRKGNLVLTTHHTTTQAQLNISKTSKILKTA